MKKALLFGGPEPILVSAMDVKNGLYSRYSEFVDPEYEFKVQYVNGARNNGGPYFRLYYSYEEYKRLHPDRADRYQIVANMRRYQESKWHREWKSKMKDFCELEKYVKNSETKKYKYADAYYDKTKTCIEFQHSYIAFDFEERNAFYANLKIKTIWLYDLPNANVVPDENGNLEILEDNARGFFRISENPENLKNNFVYIQVKSGDIYRVKELLRKNIQGEHKSTIRYFVPDEKYAEEEFVNAIKNDVIGVENKQFNERRETCPKTIGELWKLGYNWMVVRNVKNNMEIYMNRDALGGIYRNYNDCIMYQYSSSKSSYCSQYPLSHREEKSPVWVLVKSSKSIQNAII
jgi:hypothetical protein